MKYQFTGNLTTLRNIFYDHEDPRNFIYFHVEEDEEEYDVLIEDIFQDLEEKNDYETKVTLIADDVTESFAERFIKKYIFSAPYEYDVNKDAEQEFPHCMPWKKGVNTEWFDPELSIEDMAENIVQKHFPTKD